MLINDVEYPSVDSPYFCGEKRRLCYSSYYNHCGGCPNIFKTSKGKTIKTSLSIKRTIPEVEFRCSCRILAQTVILYMKKIIPTFNV